MAVPWLLGAALAMAGEGSGPPAPASLPSPWGPLEAPASVTAPPAEPSPPSSAALWTAETAPGPASRELTVADPLARRGAWGLHQWIEVPVPGELRTLHVHDDVSVRVMPAASRRVLVRTDPGLLAEARSAFVDGRLSLYHESEAPPPRYEVEGPLPVGVRTEGRARVEVVDWKGPRLELWAWGDSVIEVRGLRTDLLVVVARENARVRVTGDCEAGEVRADLADAATFSGCER